MNMNLLSMSLHPQARAGRGLAFAALFTCIWSSGAFVRPAFGQAAAPMGEAPATAGGPIRLRQATMPTPEPTGTRGTVINTAPGIMPAAVAPSEFEVYVRRITGGLPIQSLGTDWIASFLAAQDTSDYNPLVPPDYLLRAGDELVITLWGSVDADLRLVVDRSGRITIPRVGPVMVSGVRYSDLTDVISRRVGQVFKNYQLSVSLGQLRGVRVFLTGYVNRPGSVMVNSLSTMAQALLRAGGPTSAGTFRAIQLRRGRDTVVTFDLYDLLLRGDRSADQLVQPDDVIHVGPVGPQVALIGSVNRQAIFELKAGETVGDVLRMAGGFSPVADSTRLLRERFSDRTQGRVAELSLPENAKSEPASGDVLRAVNAADVAQPIDLKNKRIRVEGEVLRPGEYVLPPSGTISEAMRAAGGPSPKAYFYATMLTRESVRQTQQRNYERALRDLEVQTTTANATRRADNADEAAMRSASNASTARLFEQLRELRPDGRIVLQLKPDATELPDLVLEDGDRIYIPARLNTVGVYGSVFNTGSFLFSPNRNLGDYLRLAGGPTRGADNTSVFVIRANGTVSSSLQLSTLFSRGNQIADFPAEPGDTIFVPEEMNKTSRVQDFKDWTQILYQFGIGLAGMKSAVQ